VVVLKEECWITVCANIKYVKRIGYDNVYKSLKSIFKNDLLDFVRSDITCDANQDDIYILVKCRNYYSHLDRLKKCEYIYDVLGSYNSPLFVSDAEVDTYRNSIELKSHSSNFFSVGDFVEIMAGDFRNLSGIIDHIDEDIIVMLKLFTKEFYVPFSPKNLKLLKNTGATIDAPYKKRRGSNKQ